MTLEIILIPAAAAAVIIVRQLVQDELVEFPWRFSLRKSLPAVVVAGAKGMGRRMGKRMDIIASAGGAPGGITH